MRRKKTEPILKNVKPSTTDIFRSLMSVTNWLKILLENSKEKKYEAFLRQMLDNNFLEANKEILTVREIAEHTKCKPPQAHGRSLDA